MRGVPRLLLFSIAPAAPKIPGVGVSEAHLSSDKKNGGTVWPPRLDSRNSARTLGEIRTHDLFHAYVCHCPNLPTPVNQPQGSVPLGATTGLPVTLSGLV